MDGLASAVIILLIIILVVYYTNRNKTVINKSVVSPNDVDPQLLSALMLARSGQSAEGFAIHGDNAGRGCDILGLHRGDFPQVPSIACGNKVTQPYDARYGLNVFARDQPEPAFEIRLLYKEGCGKHKLKMIFDEIAKQYTSRVYPRGCGIRFTTEIVDDTLPANLFSGFPKLIKIRRNGQVLTYTGHANYGQVYDWIMNESLLF